MRTNKIKTVRTFAAEVALKALLYAGLVPALNYVASVLR